MCLCEIALSIYLWREALGEEVCRALGVGISWWDPHSVLLGVPFWAVLRTAGQGQDPSLEDSGQARCSLSCMVVLRSIPHSLSKS